MLIDDPCEDPKRKPLRTNFVLLGWSSVNLVDQVEHLNLGLGFSGPDRSDRSRGPVWPVQGVTASFWTDRSDRSVGPVWPVCTDRATASFWKWGIYTPQPSPLSAAGSLAFLSFPKPFSWPASSPKLSLWVVLTRLHILRLGWEIECVWAKWPLWELHFEQLRASIAWALLVLSKIFDLHLLLLEVCLLDG